MKSVDKEKYNLLRQHEKSVIRSERKLQRLITQLNKSVYLLKEKDHKLKLMKYNQEKEVDKMATKSYFGGLATGVIATLGIMYIAGCATIDTNKYKINQPNPSIKSDTYISKPLFTQKQYMERNIYNNGIEEIIKNEMKNDTYFIKEKSHKFTPFPQIPEATPGVYNPEYEI